MTRPVATVYAAELTAARVGAIRDVLGRLLNPSDRMLGRIGHVIVECVGPGGSIRPSRKDTGLVLTVGNAAREVLFEAAHVLAEELGVQVPGETFA